MTTPTANSTTATMNWIRTGAQRLTTSVTSLDRIDLVTIMSSLLVLQHSDPVSDRLLTTSVFAAIVIPAVRRSGIFWLFIAGLRFMYQMPDYWVQIDNHQYLITWWCLALGLSLFAGDVGKTLRVTARLLIGLCFLFATAWKFRSPDFLNGDFFSWTFGTDKRLRAFAQSFLGFPNDGPMINQQARQLLKEGAIGSTEVMATGPRVRPMAIAAAWYTVVIEGSVAVLYLLPARFKATRFAPWALLVFIVTVYPIAPVVGFALTLLTLSVAGNTTSRRWTLAASVLFALIPLVRYAEDAFDIIG